jgi:hypothetical protein
VQALRLNFRRRKAVDRRDWVKRHLRETWDVDGNLRKEYFLDLAVNTADLHCAVSQQARPQVCLEWFTFELGVTTTFIYQPHIPEKEFQVELSGRVNNRREKTSETTLLMQKYGKLRRP